MRELERPAADTTEPDLARGGPRRVGVVGRGRLGTALAAALRSAGCEVDGPAGRGDIPDGEAIVLCVPDQEIPAAAAAVAGAAPLVGHTSGATPLSALEPAARSGTELFGLHPLQTFTRGPLAPERFRGSGCAIAGSTPTAAKAAAALAQRLGMTPFELDDGHRAAYHAAASIASNFLVTVEGAAESVAGAAGIEATEARRLLAPLVRASVESWIELGARDALTGPIARGDETTIAAQRRAVAAGRPELLHLFDALTDATRALTGRAGSDRRAA